MSEGFQDSSVPEEQGKPEGGRRETNESGKLRNAAELAALKQNIIDSLDIQAFYEKHLNGEVLKFKSDGWSLHVHCPIHGDSGKPNLSVNKNSGGFKCFSCGKAGSAFDFWCFTHGLEPKSGFQEALVELATQAGINIYSDRAYAPRPVDSKVSTGKTFVPKINKAAAADSSVPPIPMADVLKYHTDLQPEHYKYLLFQRGLKANTIEKYMVGWDVERQYKSNEGRWSKGKFTIPILGKDGLCRNVRVYAQDAPSDMKMINTKPYGSPSRLFPLNEIVKLKPSHIIYCEGEFDCMLMNQHLEEAGLLREGGWIACTNTAGCNTFEAEWMEYFLGTNVIFMLDVDPPGKTWASSHATNFFLAPLSTGNIESFKIVHLPLDGTKDNKDIGDYFIKIGGTFEDLFRVIESTPLAVISTPEVKDGEQSADKVSQSVYSEMSVEPIEVPSFVECIKNRAYIDQRVRVPLTISGECTKIYHAPRQIRVTSCPLMADDGCCSAGAGIQTIPYGDVAFIECCMATKKSISSTLQNIACSKGKPCKVDEVEKVVMQEFFAHQVVKRLTAEQDENGRMVNSQQLVTTSLYILQPEKHIAIGPQDYDVIGYVRSHPQTRQATLFVEHMDSLEEDWKKFEVNDESIAHLKVIQGFAKVKDLFDEFTSGVTQIYNSDDILLSVLLSYLSPMWFSFNNEIIRGWINSCIIGDSGTGKTATYIRISDWLNLGDLFSALSGTRTGLLYSIKQKGTEWYVQIGRYVTASGKIIAVDETQELNSEETAKMAKAMDEGWLDVNQVASGGYKTQTRTIFLMNPKPPKKISDFAYGCQALSECFIPMFIRRLDMAVFTTGKEDISFYNQQYKKEESKKLTITPEIFRSLIYWAWTREIDDVVWSSESTATCLEKAIELASIYGHSDDIPLVLPQDFRNKLARVSTAFAILSGSFTEDYTGVVVKPEHVTRMAKFFDVLYSSQACNLRQYSKNSSKKKTLGDFETIKETFDTVIANAKSSPDQRWSQGQHFLQLVLMLQQQQFIRKRDLAEQLGVTLQWIQKHIAILQMYNLVEMYHGGYKTTRKFNLYMQKWQQDPEVEEMLEGVAEKIGKLAMLNNLDDDRGSYYHDKMYDDPFRQ